MEIHAVNCHLVNMAVVIYQKPHVVLMEFIAAQTDTAVRVEVINIIKKFSLSPSPFHYFESFFSST